MRRRKGFKEDVCLQCYEEFPERCNYPVACREETGVAHRLSPKERKGASRVLMGFHLALQLSSSLSFAVFQIFRPYFINVCSPLSVFVE